MTTTLNHEAAHRYFAAHCFNEAWTLLRKSDRTPDEETALIALAHASLYHWSQRPDVSRQNYAISYWQLSRVYAACGQGENARWWGQRCQEYSQGEGAFYEGYACEALARAAQVLGDSEGLRRYKAEALALAAEVTEPDERATLIEDVESLVE